MTKLWREIIKHEVFWKYVISGLGVTCFEFIVMALMIYVWHWWYLLASAVVFFVGLVLSFFARKHWVFGKACLHNDLKQLSLYSLVFVLSTIVNLIIMYFLVEKLQVLDLIAQLMSNALLGIFTFIFNKTVTFKPLVKQELTLSAYFSKDK